jgi:type I site-specific restriction endonuclease
MTSESSLKERFRAGLEGKDPRKHQIACVLQQVACTGVTRKRFLHQHAPGSGKSEVILMLASELLRLGKADSVVILNYATELEEQMVQRAKSFWHNTGFDTLWKRSRSSAEVFQPLHPGYVFFSLLQKFHDIGTESGESGGDQPFRPFPCEDSARIVVIIDEAHRGVPDEGVYSNNVLKRYGEEQTQIFFTATPKADTLISHGTMRQDAHGTFFSADTIHTQDHAVSARYTLNPLEKYHNGASEMKADGQTLVQLNGKVTMKDFLLRLQKQRSSSLLEQQASYIMKNLQAVYDDMPNMRHQIKHLVVTDSQQSVYDLGERLKALIVKKGVKNNLGNRLKTAVFFSGVVKTSKAILIRDREANGQEPINRFWTMQTS